MFCFFTDMNNNNNNYKTSIVPITSKWIELSGEPSTGLGKLKSGYDAKFINSDQVARKLRKDRRVWKGEFFKCWCKETMLFDHLTWSKSKFQIVGTATEKARVPVWVLTLGTDNKWEKMEQWFIFNCSNQNSCFDYISSALILTLTINVKYS